MDAYISSLRSPLRLELKGESLANNKHSASPTSVETLIKLRDCSLSNNSTKEKLLRNAWRAAPHGTHYTASPKDSSSPAPPLLLESPDKLSSSGVESHSIQKQMGAQNNHTKQRDTYLGKRTDRPHSIHKAGRCGSGGTYEQAWDEEKPRRRASDVDCRRAKKRVLRRLREERLQERIASERSQNRLKAREIKRLQYQQQAEMKERRRRRIYARNAVFRLMYESQQNKG